MAYKSKQEARLNLNVARKFRQALIDNGYKGRELDILMAQAAHETNGFNHGHAVENNNYGGIKYITALRNVATQAQIIL
jgi:hypothetical protein